MADAINPAATEHLPSFITAPGQTDVLMVIMAIVLVLAVLGFGILFFRLHTLPERLAHKSQKLQFEIVAVLGLIALFTHMHIFWVIGLILALIDLPDFGTTLGRIARSTEKMAGITPAEAAAELPAGANGDVAAVTPAAEPNDGGTPAMDVARKKQKELGHA
jgi:hypothetical protein